MCGIAGLIGCGQNISSQTLDIMSDRIKHRGPDHCDLWVSQDQTIGLVHRRLSILELSDKGNQPMASASGRYMFVFNGEIYNHLELRQQISSVNWRGTSDTETLLACFEAWGIAATVKKATGMFGFAVYDQQTHTLHLCRDRYGEKPIYFGRVSGQICFASELGAILALPDADFTINRQAIRYFLQTGTYKQGVSILQNINQLRPGRLVAIECNSGTYTEEVYWQAESVFLSHINTASTSASKPDMRSRDAKDYIDALDAQLQQIIAGQMMADVPVGAFLSGGIDSSLVVSIMQSLHAAPVHTFTVGFKAGGYDESGFAGSIAKTLHTDHTTILLEEDEALDIAMQMPQIFSEPFGDASQLPTYLVSRLAAQHVKVVLTGDGGDEMFAGYNRHVFTHYAYDRFAPLSRLFRPFAAPSRPLSCLYAGVRKLARPFSQLDYVMTKLQKLGMSLGADGPLDLYGRLRQGNQFDVQEMLQHSLPSSDLVAEGTSVQTGDSEFLPEGLSQLQAMILLDVTRYLPEDILVKVDRASMANSLEVRCPFLDHRLLEFSMGLPVSMKIRQRRGKYILRKLLSRYIDVTLFDRPKQGFSVPLARWLNGPLQNWASHLLDKDRLDSGGILQGDVVAGLWGAHQKGDVRHTALLWHVIMLQSWCEAQQTQGVVLS